jgi:hypothetical protein
VGAPGSNISNGVVGGLSGLADASELRLNVAAINTITDAAGNAVVPVDYSTPNTSTKQVYTVDTTSVSISAGGVALAGTNVVDGAFQTDEYLSRKEMQVLAPIISASVTALAPGASTVVRITLPVGLGASEVFDSDDLVFAGGTISAFTVTSDPQVYTLTFTRNAAGNGSNEAAPGLLVKAGAFLDAYGNPSAPAVWHPTATDFNGLAYPTVTVGQTGWNNSTMTVSFAFSTAISGFDASDVIVTGGTLGAVIDLLAGLGAQVAGVVVAMRQGNAWRERLGPARAAQVAGVFDSPRLVLRADGWWPE